MIVLNKVLNLKRLFIYNILEHMSIESFQMKNQNKILKELSLYKVK